MRSLLITVMACLFATSAMANQTFDLGGTFSLDMQDSCRLNEKKEVDCTDPNNGKVVAQVGFNGVVDTRANLTQVRLQEIANDPAAKEKSGASMKKRVLEWLTSSGGKLASNWNEPIADVVKFGDLWVTYGAAATADGVFLMKTQIWYDGQSYEMNTIIVDSKQNLDALMDSMKTLRVKG